MTTTRRLELAVRRRAVAAALRVASLAAPAAMRAPQRPAAASPSAPAPDAVDILRLVTEFDVNGLKVLVKRRVGSQTVAAGAVHPRRLAQHHVRERRRRVADAGPGHRGERELSARTPAPRTGAHRHGAERRRQPRLLGAHARQHAAVLRPGLGHLRGCRPASQLRRRRLRAHQEAGADRPQRRGRHARLVSAGADVARDLRGPSVRERPATARPSRCAG